MDLLELLAVLSAIAAAGATWWVLKKIVPEEGRRAGNPLNPPRMCDYCGRCLAMRCGERLGLTMRGRHYCDIDCYMRAESRDMDERSLGHRG